MEEARLHYTIRVHIEQLAEGAWLGTSDDLPGLVVEAATLEELKNLTPKVARDLIDSYLDTHTPLPAALLAQRSTSEEVRPRGDILLPV